MKRFKGKAGRALSILFAIALIVTSIPQNVLQVSAAQDGVGDESIIETPADKASENVSEENTLDENALAVSGG